jgi:hypothetical protein
VPELETMPPGSGPAALLETLSARTAADGVLVDGSRNSSLLPTLATGHRRGVRYAMEDYTYERVLVLTGSRGTANRTRNCHPVLSRTRRGRAMGRATLTGVVAVLLVLAVVLGAIAILVKALKWLLIIAVLMLVVGLVSGVMAARRGGRTG